MEVTVSPGGELEQLQLMLADSRNRVFADPRVREAFLHAIPRAELAASVDAPVIDSFLVPPSAARYADMVAGEVSTDYTQPEPAVSAALLAEAGVAGVSVCVL